jgi:hypothetical protein
MAFLGTLEKLKTESSEKAINYRSKNPTKAAFIKNSDGKKQRNL